MAKYLDDNGLSYLWQKIKAHVNTAISAIGKVPTGGTAGQILAKASGTDYDTEWITNSGAGNYLPISGGTLTGQLEIPDSAVTDASQAPSASQYGSALYITDQQGRRVGYLGLVQEADDKLWTQTGVTRDVNGSPAYNSLWLGLKDDGTPTVYFSGSAAQQAWRDALGIGTVKELDVSSNVSVATSTDKSLGSLTLEAGKWVVEYGASYSSASSGIACTYLFTSKDVGANAYWYRATCVQTSVSGSNTWHQGSTILNLSATTTIYLTVWHNTGSAKNCTGQMRAIKVG